MQEGQYIKDRWMEALIQEICINKNIEINSFSDKWIFELSKLGKRAFIFGYTFSLNSASATSIAADKVATFQALKAGGIPAVEHYLARTKVSTDTAWHSRIKGQVVVKPLVGASGHGVNLFEDISKATGYINENIAIKAWSVSPFANINSETRLVVLDGEVLLAYSKKPVSIKGLKMFNLGLGATALSVKPTQAQKDLAPSAVDAIGLRVAAVDIVELYNDTQKVLEINDGIMMENFMRQSVDNKRVTKNLYSKIIDAMF